MRAYVDQQAFDKILLVRSKKDNTAESKLEAMEWMCRYMGIIKNKRIEEICRAFNNEFKTSNASPQSQAMRML